MLAHFSKIAYLVEHTKASRIASQSGNARACDQLKSVFIDPLELINNYLKSNHKMRALKGRHIVAQGVSPGFGMENRFRALQGRFIKPDILPIVNF